MQAELQTLLVDDREAGRMLSVCSKTIRNLAGRGELTPIRLGRAVRFSVDDLRRFIDRQRTESNGNGTH